MRRARVISERSRGTPSRKLAGISQILGRLGSAPPSFIHGASISKPSGLRMTGVPERVGCRDGQTEN